MKFIVTSRKGAAVAVAFMLSAPTVALIGVNPALASTDSFSLYSQTSDKVVQPPKAIGSKSISMTVSPSSVAPNAPIEVQVGSSNFALGNGPAAQADSGTYEVAVVIHLDGIDYTLRGSKIGQNVAPCSDPDPCTTNSLFKAGWLTSSTPGNSSSESISDGVSVAGTTGIGATIRGLEDTPVSLVAPSSVGSYQIGLKAIVANGLFAGGSSSATANIQYNQPTAGKNRFDTITNTSAGSGWNVPCSFTCSGTDGPAQTLVANTNAYDGTDAARGDFVFATPVTIDVVPPTEPAAPAKPGATAGNAQATVTWTAPANGGSAITSYAVTSVAPDALKSCAPSVATALTCTVTGLANGTAYTFKVTATNLIGTSSDSPTSDAVTPEAPAAPTAPEAPAAPTVVAGDGSLAVSWLAPADGGSPITGYVATAQKVAPALPVGPSRKYKVLVADPSCSSAALSCTISGVTNGDEYVVSVVATNDVGSSDASPGSDPVTPTTTDVDTSPRSATATLATVYCQPNNIGLVPVPDEFNNWPVTITVAPGAAAPGSLISVEVSLDASATNGPATTINPGQYRFEASIKFNGSDSQLIGPSNTGTAPPNDPIYGASELPLVAAGTVTLPTTEGDFPVTLNGFIFNNVLNGDGEPPVGNFFTSQCNAGSAPVTSPQGFDQPTVDITSSNGAPPSTVTPIPTEEPIPDDSSDTSGGGLPKTGANPFASLWVAIILFQIGLIMAVRSVRAIPVKTARHL